MATSSCVLVFRRDSRAWARGTPAATELSDRALQDLLAEDPSRGWRAFIDQYTPALLG